MAPTRDNYPARVALYAQNTTVIAQKTPRLSMENLHRTISDISVELRKEAEAAADEMKQHQVLPPISEVEDAKCECCGMCEECTPEYISRVRAKFSGKLICGLCSEAVKEEMEKTGGKKEEALREHMNACSKFNKFGRSHPVLFQAQVMKEILKKGSARAKSSSPRDLKADVSKKGGIARSSSCIPAIMKDSNCTDPNLIN
ncbi:4Fe-4S ferredoxin-type domain-containing protein [Heracleum sosnowskyi]|uniref:4Fe-4S ferredoxin-type domain-containing protein n=1 Tax=Heracleum sosnowskyi TaxID=360622 RepID=A0AAD8HUX0_9APIA|nr:4Fe-4S ferredoxin-type domain-containing protein [Heracleum sosnowskyi]